jgi:hypothetical protein
MLAKIKDFFITHEHKIILVFGFVLVAAISFEAGVMKGSKMGQDPVKIEQVASAEASRDNASQEATKAQNLAPETAQIQGSQNIVPQNCAYVGSKNSNKYHLPTCRWAKNIKPENLVCFKDENEAKLKGYLPDKNCIK